MVRQLDSLTERVESAAEAIISASATEIPPTFPEKITGEIVFRPRPYERPRYLSGELTYQDNVSKEEIAWACMASNDSGFDAIAKPTDILVVGATFGHGSSRKQGRQF